MDESRNRSIALQFESHLFKYANPDINRYSLLFHFLSKRRLFPSFETCQITCEFSFFRFLSKRRFPRVNRLEKRKKKKKKSARTYRNECIQRMKLISKFEAWVIDAREGRIVRKTRRRKLRGGGAGWRISS